MSQIPMPLEVEQLAPISEALDRADHTGRLEWIRGLNARQQLKLYALAQGNPVQLSELVGDEGEVIPHFGKNGLPLTLISAFEKRFVRIGELVVGFNHNDWALGPLKPVARWVTGPGHYTAYDSPEVPGEVWIDYRTVTPHSHPDFPPIIDNDHGTRALIFGNMVDVLRRASRHVFIGNAFKDFDPPAPLTLACRLGSLFPTAPFVLVQAPR